MRIMALKIGKVGVNTAAVEEFVGARPGRRERLDSGGEDLDSPPLRRRESSVPPVSDHANHHLGF
jgi:hypothetical protein